MKLFSILLVIFIVSCSSTKKSIDEQYPEYLAIANNNSVENYSLEGSRLPLKRPVPNYTCSAQGKVIVGIKVNKQGVVIEAVPGIKGTTTKDKCLFERSKEAAMKTKWQASANAPEKQIGKIIYNFSLY